MRAPLLTLAFLLSAPAMAEMAQPRLSSAVLPVRPVSMAVDAFSVLQPGGDRNTASADAASATPPTSPGTSQVPLVTAPCPPLSLSLRDARALVRRIAEQERFFPDFILAVAETESGFHAGKSGARGYGLMQLSEARARASQVDRCDPAQNVLGGVRVLRDLHARYRNPFYILAGWQAGEEALLDADGLPPRLETLRFLADVMDRFYDWPALRDGRQVGVSDARAMAIMSAGASGTTPVTRQRMAGTGTIVPRPSLRPAAPPSLQPDTNAAPASRAEPVPWRSGFVASFD